MRAAPAILGLVLALTLASSAAAQAPCLPLPGAGGAAPPDPAAPAGEALLVLPKDSRGQIPRDFALAEGVEIEGSYWSPVLCATVARIRGPETLELAEMVEDLPPTALIVSNSTYRPAATSVRPILPAPDSPEARPDPYRSVQYGLDRAGVDAARTVTTGRGARLAVLDSAPATDHPDLPGFRVLGEAREAGLHGTLVLGVIAAVPRNGIGIAGAAPRVEVLAAAICRPTGADGEETCPLYDVIQGVDHAWESGAQVVNMAVSGPPNRILERAMQRLDGLGIAVVAAAGNEGTREPRYPAAYPSVVGVGAIDREGKPFEAGNSGRSVEIVAPGVEIVSTIPGGGFAFSDGTSLATAHVSAVLALLVAASGDVPASREALFRSGFAQPMATEATAVLPPVCEPLARLGHACP